MSEQPVLENRPEEETVIIRDNIVMLPESIARKMRGKTITVEETDQGILLRYARDPIAAARGFLRGKRFNTETYLRRKQEDLALEG